MSTRELTHFNPQGDVHMVDVGEKAPTRRLAVAQGRIRMQPETLARIVSGKHDKGDVLAVARVAGIMGAKRTADLIPLCHPLPLTRIDLDLRPFESPSSVLCTAQVETVSRTGVEMEALTAVQIALLTVYDMCKAVDRGMTIDGVRLMEKSCGRSGRWVRP